MGSDRAMRRRTTATVDVARARLAARILIQLMPTAVVDDIIPTPTTPIAIIMNTVYALKWPAFHFFRASPNPIT
jgi:hypothetical protein